MELDQPSYGGYDCEFVDTIPNKYTCSICTKVLRDAHLTECCGQHFCASCLTHWLGTQQGRKTCPHCRQEDFHHIVNKAINHEVNEFKIHCLNRKEGCGWVGELGGLKSHLDKGCSYAVVTCTNKGCRKRVNRKELQTHLADKCYYRPYECEHCGHKDTYTAITGEIELGLIGGHYSKCPEYPLACSNGCGVTGIRRRAMPDHHSSCPLETVNCPFEVAGCTEKIARKNVANHITANQQKHMMHMLLTIHSLQQSNHIMRQELHYRIDRNQRELHLLKDDMIREINSLEESIQHNTNTPESTAQSLRRMKSILQVSLDEIGDTLTFRVTDFPQLRKERKVWHSPPFNIGDKVRVHLAVHPSGVGRGQGSHVSVSLILMEVLKMEENVKLQYDVLVAAIGQQRSATFKIVELCTIRKDNMPPVMGLTPYACSAYFSFPSPGEVLRSEEVFLKVEEANSLLVNTSLMLELKLLNHQHHRQHDHWW